MKISSTMLALTLLAASVVACSLLPRRQPAAGDANNTNLAAGDANNTNLAAGNAPADSSSGSGGIASMTPPVLSSPSDDSLTPPPLSNDSLPPPPSNRPPVSGGVLTGRVTSRVEPIYPPPARAVRASGPVTVQVLVSEEGSVLSASAISGHALLRASATLAVRQWQFSPMRLSSQPVRMSGVVTVNFTLQ